MATLGTVAGCWRYPVKSMQGTPCDALSVGPNGVAGDRARGLIDAASGKLCSAKRFSALLMAEVCDDRVTLPSGEVIELDSPQADDRLSEWLGRPVTVERPSDTLRVYEMTFDPANDEAELFDIPAPAGTFLDWAPLHMVSSTTLAHCNDRHPELDWDVRRFRPNVLADLSTEPFSEDGWVGRRLRIGEVVLTVKQPTVRCAMPLRAQPGLGRQPAMHAALDGLNPTYPNHLGVYLDVAGSGNIRTGDPIELLS